MRWNRRRRPPLHTVGLGVAAASATSALAAAEVLRIWRRARRPGAADRGQLLRDGRTAARDTVGVLRAGYRTGSANETALLNLFLSFGGTFAAARVVTHSIRRGWGPLRNVEIGRRHIHHFVPGILLAVLSGAVSIGLRHEPSDQWLALPFGAGAALIVDETALLIELSDVYWSERGVLSIDVGLGAVSALGSLAFLVRLARRGEAVVLG
jgi:hypothetical protein